MAAGAAGFARPLEALRHVAARRTDPDPPHPETTATLVRASADQRRKLEAIFTGQKGGPMAVLGPLVATWLPAIFMYKMAFTRNEVALGAASAVMMLMTVAAIMVPYLYSELRQAGKSGHG